MAFNIGVNVVEVDGRAAPTIVAAPISIAGMLVRSQRGVPNSPVHIRGLGDFTAAFGSFSATAFGAHAVRGFFDNGGTEAVAVRIVGAGSAPAEVTLTDRNPPALPALPIPTLRVRAGLLGYEDPGEWGRALAITIVDHPRGTTAIPAQIIGSVAEPFALVAGQTLDITVNGAAPPVTITFRAADFANIASASAAEVAAAINRQTAALRAGVTPNRRVLISSATPGPNSRIAVAASTAGTTLGFTAGTANSDAGLAVAATLAAVQTTGGFLPGSAVRIETRGRTIAPNALAPPITAGSTIAVTADGGAPVNVTFANSDFVNPAAPTPGEVVAVINRQATGFTSALTSDNRLVLMSNTFGPSSTMALAGTAPVIASLGLTGNAPAAGARVHCALDAVSEPNRYISWTPGLAAALSPNFARVQSVEFDLIVSRNGLEVERFESVSMQNTLDYYVAAVVNDQDRGSRYIVVQNLSSVSGPGLNAPAPSAPGSNFQLAGGSDGNTPVDIHYIGDPAARTGLYAFDTVPIQLLACPETSSPGVVAAALTYCENRGDAMFVGSPPPNFDLDGIMTYASQFRARKVYGALYAPWIQVVNPIDNTGNNPRIWIPPVGHVLGAFARIGDARGVWKAPAGDEARLNNALGVEFDMTDVDHTNLVKNGGVNGIRAIPGSGVIIDASRTLSTDTRWLFVNVRRLFNFVKSSLREGLRFVAQEPHTEALRRSVKFNVVTPFLLGLWRQGAFGSDAPEQVFTVVCGPENNPPAEVNLGNFRIEVYFYPVKPAETIIIIVGQQESGASASEA